MNKPSTALCGRLRHVFLQKPTSTAVAPTVRDENLLNFANQFKKDSNSPGFRRNSSAYKSAVRRLTDAGQFSAIHDILDHQKRYPDIKVEHFTVRLIRLYGEAKMVDHAQKLFDKMPQLKCPQTVISFNALLASCLPSRRFWKIRELFRELPGKLSIKPNAISYNYVIGALCEMGHLDEAMLMLKEMVETGVEPNVVTFDSLLGAFYCSGMFKDAENLWELMLQKNVVPDLRCHNWRLHGLLGENRLPEAMELLNGLEGKGLKPDAHTYNMMIKANERNLDEVKKLYRTMVDKGCDLDSITCMTVITFAFDENDIDFAFELCKKHFGVKNGVSNKIMKIMIDELVERSEMDKAKELSELVESKHKMRGPG
ncbi:Pentatricopeptide repeat-containing protein -mitochondrial [Striga hermonthica]|uniref:Pentatricopeptide repeat-containing protein -mitochondrial n=1 Tax=Striga hermonthica TaxID=68872 RepID=A0A9N7RIZ4_STRHE|nr:Pentatricopeptide repeat-containing protein -mitochondrial [Striga hermonthica]